MVRCLKWWAAKVTLFSEKVIFGFAYLARARTLVNDNDPEFISCSRWGSAEAPSRIQSECNSTVGRLEARGDWISPIWSPTRRCLVSLRDSVDIGSLTALS